MQLLRKTVSVPFRALVAELYPGLGANRSYWQFFSYLLFGTFFDGDTKQLVICQDLLAKIAEKPVNHCRAIDFLEAFRRDVLSPETFEWTKWAGNKGGCGKCRQVKKLVLHPRLEEAFDGELSKLHHNAGRIYFVDGTEFSRCKQINARKNYRRAAIERWETTDCDIAKEVLGYLNGLSSNLFSKLLRRNLPRALAVAESLEKSDVRRTQLRILQAIVDQPQPFYAPSPKKRTVRIFGMNECLLSLKGDVRRALTHGCSEADLANSQLAICAKLWDITAIEDFLASGKNFWVYLCEQLGYTAEDKNWLKSAFKQPLYSACFGMPKPKVQGSFTYELKKKNIERGGARLVQSPLMAALLEARGRMVERIKADGGGLDCFGKWIEVNSSVSVDSVLAQQAQAVELKLLYPLIKLAKEHSNDFTVLLWQHDGVTVHFHRRRERWESEISKAVQSEIDALGIRTRLEWKHCTDKEERSFRAEYCPSIQNNFSGAISNPHVTYKDIMVRNQTIPR